jgi:hypothetical protein
MQGMAQPTRSGPWSAEEVDRFLVETRVPMRVACNGSGAHPLLASLWYRPQDGLIWCATQKSASLARLLVKDPHCAFEVSVETPPYHGVRGQAIARFHDDRGEEMLRALIERYVGTSAPRLAKALLANVETETAIALHPKTLTSWDYRERMQEVA